MRLLTPTQNKDARQQQIARDIIRTKETEDVVKRANIRLAKSEADFADFMARNKDIWAKAEEEHAERMRQMQSEVEVLEGRKRMALIPIDMYKKEADDLMQTARDMLAKATEREEDAEDLQELLEEKLTSVADREQAVEKEEQRQTIAKSGIEIQQDQTRKQAEILSGHIAEWNAYKHKEEASLYERKKEVTLAEISFIAKTDKIKRDVESIASERIALKDLRETLERALRSANVPI